MSVQPEPDAIGHEKIAAGAGSIVQDALEGASLPGLGVAAPSDTRNIAKAIERCSYPPFTEQEFEQVDNVLSELDINALSDAINQRFVQMGDEARIIAISIKAGMEIILHGPSGYGKSDVVRFVIQHLGLNDYTAFVDFGASTTEADLYGGVDIKKFKQDDELRFRTNESFMQYPIAVFEEALDGSNPRVLHSLRSLLTSGIFTKNGKDERVRTKLIIVCTNQSPDEFAQESLASAAFLSRFPVRCEMKWRSHEANDYFELLIRRFPEVDTDSISFISDVFAKVSASNNRGPAGTTRVVSPKEAIQALELITKAEIATPAAGDKFHITKDHLWVLLCMPTVFGQLDDCVAVFRESEELKRFDYLHTVLDGSLTELEKLDASKFENIAALAEGTRDLGRILDQVIGELDQWTDTRKSEVKSLVAEAGQRLRALMQKVVNQPIEQAPAATA